MNEECEAVKTTLWAEAPTAGWPPSLRSEIFNVSNERTQNPMAGKIRDDWWVRPSHGEDSGLREPRFWIRVFLLLDRLPAKANEPCLPTLNNTHTHTHTHTHNHFTASLHLIPDNHANIPPLSFLQVGCPSCHPTNSVKALKAMLSTKQFSYYFKFLLPV